MDPSGELVEYLCDSARRLGVCAGPAVVDADTGSFVVRAQDTTGMAGGGGMGGVSPAGETIIIGYQTCLGPGSYQSFVAPGQEVLVGSSSAACDESRMEPVVADESGRLNPGWSGYVYVAIPADEFECFYLSSFGDPSHCGSE